MISKIRMGPLIKHGWRSLSTTFNSREENISLMKDKVFDVLIIGGGAVGSGIALDATTRGLSTCMIEKNDFSSATSSRSTKLLHGGIRYLQTAFLDNLIKFKFSAFKSNFNLVKNALRERNHLLHTAPHLTNWLPILVPFYTWFKWPHSLLLAGMKVYDAMAMFPKHSYVMMPSEAENQFPMIKTNNLKYCAVFWEGQQNDSRTGVTIALTAASHGAVIANYVEAKEAIRMEGSKRIIGFNVVDKVTNESFKIKAKSVIFAGGPYSDQLLQMENKDRAPIIKGAGGTHIIVPNYYCSRSMGLADMATSDGRILFFLPWLNHTIIGTTDSPSKIVDLPSPSEEEIQWILHEVEKYLSKDLKVRRSDVLSAWNGIRPLVSDPSAKDTASISRDHTHFGNKETGTVTICGGKWTTYREMADDAVNKLLEIHPEFATKVKPCQTLTTLLLGAEGYSPTLPILLAQKFGFTKSVCTHLSKTYGTKAYEVVELEGVKKWPSTGKKIVDGYPYLESEIKYAIKEYCRTVTDMIAHRTRLAFLNIEAARESIPKIASIMRDELNWSGEEEAKQILNAEYFLSTFGGPVVREGVQVKNHLKHDLLDAFRAIDSDNSGDLDREEVLNLSKKLGFEFSQIELEQFFSEMDKNNDGKINYEEFSTWWRKDGANAHSFKDKFINKNKDEKDSLSLPF